MIPVMFIGFILAVIATALIDKYIIRPYLVCDSCGHKTPTSFWDYLTLCSWELGFFVVGVILGGAL